MTERARVVKGRRHASVPGCGVPVGLLGFFYTKTERVGVGAGGGLGLQRGLRALGPSSFILQASLSSLILSGQLTVSASGLSESL